MHHATLYLTLTSAVPAATPKVGTAAAKVGTPESRSPGVGKRTKRQQQCQETVWWGRNTYMTVSMSHTGLPVPSVPTCFSRNRFPMRGFYTTRLTDRAHTRMVAQAGVARAPIQGWLSATGRGYTSGHTRYCPTACRPGANDGSRG